MRDLLDKIGKTAEHRCGKFIFEVGVKDVRQVYGRTDYLVIPIAGRGKAWVSAASLTFKDGNRLYDRPSNA